MTEHRSWFPFILVGLSLALLAIVALVYQPGASDDAPMAAAPLIVAPTAQVYEGEVRHVLSVYSQDNNAVNAYNTLLLTRVPDTSYQAVHLDLVIAFAELQNGKTEAGTVHLQDAIASAIWLQNN